MRDGLDEEAPCSPDLTSPDFFLWGYIKNVVFAQRPTTRKGLMERIRRACAAISRETLPKEKELTTSTPLFLGNGKSKDSVFFFVTGHRKVTLSTLSLL